jgi:predicted AAA+ superfamily ATPase
MGTLLLREIAEMRFGQTAAPLLPDNGLESLLDQSFWRGVQQQGLARRRPRDQAFAAFSERGGYPMAQANADRPWPEVADQLNETVIQRAIQHDLRAGQAGIRRDPRLLEEVFRLACRYAGQAPGQAVYVQELRQGLGGDIGWQRVHQYLRFLESALLIKLVQPMEMRLKRRRGSPKVCLCDHGLRASWLQEVVPLTPEALSAAEHLSDLAGHLAESVAGSYLAGLSHLDIGHFPQRGMEPEVDFVLTVGDRRIPLEVKYRRRIDPFRDTLGLRAFVEKTAYNAPFGVLVTMTDDVSIPDPRLVAVSLPSLLMMR